MKARLAAGAFLAGAFMGANPAMMGAGPESVTAPHAAAAAAAQRDMDVFLAHALGGAAMDAAVLIADGSWAAPVARTGPRGFLTRFEDGTIRTASFNEVRDWVFTGADGRLYGGFRTRSLLPALPRAEAAALAATLSASPLPRTPELSPEHRDFLLAGTPGSL